MSNDTIKTYQGPSVGVSACLVALETFIGDMDGKTIGTETTGGLFDDEGTVDTSDAVTAINALIWEMERREARINQLGAALQSLVDNVLDYERVNNLSPTPGRKYCWDSVERAVAALGDQQTGAQKP